jgi:hypothetical protein
LVIAYHPVAPVEDPQVERLAIASQGLFPLDVEVLLEVGERQFPESSVQWLPKPEAHKIGLPYRAPKPVTSIESEQVLVIPVIGYELEDEGGIAEPPQGGRRKESPVEAVSLSVPEDTERTAVDLLDTVGNSIKKFLDPERAVQQVNQVELFPYQPLLEITHCPHLVSSATEHGPFRATSTITTRSRPDVALPTCPGHPSGLVPTPFGGDPRDNVAVLARREFAYHTIRVLVNGAIE